MNLYNPPVLRKISNYLDDKYLLRHLFVRKIIHKVWHYGVAILTNNNHEWYRGQTYDCKVCIKCGSLMSPTNKKFLYGRYWECTNKHWKYFEYFEYKGTN